MTSLRIFLSAGLSTLLALGVAACGDDTGTGGTGGGTGGSAGDPGTGGTPTEGGNGGTPAEGGNGGTPAEGGNGGTPAEGGGGGGAGFNLQFNGSNYGGHAGEVVYVKVRNAAGTEVAQGITPAIGNGGTFTITFDDVDAEGGNIDWMVDLNDDNMCVTAGQPDHVWREPIPANHMLAVTHNTSFSQAACDGF